MKRSDAFTELELTSQELRTRDDVMNQMNRMSKNSIARKDANEVFAHFAGDVRQHLMPVFFQLDPKHCVRQRFKDFSHDLYRFFLRHTERQTQICLCWQTLNTNMRL